MIQFIGNCRDYLDRDILEFILKTNGNKRPNELDIVSKEKREIFNLWKSSGYDLNKVEWHVYYQINLNKTFLIPPIFVSVVDWWFVKLNPGNIFPHHIDQFDSTKKIKRYWVACNDYKAGHVFSCADQLLCNYSFGDIFLFEGTISYHGAANIGFDPFISLQICTLY